MIKKKSILEWDEEILNNNIVWGIVSSIGHLKLVHFLIKTGLFNFKRNEDIEYIKNEITSYFISYSYFDSNTETLYKLFVNKGNNETIANKNNKIDMILTIETESNEIIEDTFNLLGEFKYIEAIFEIDLKKQTQRFIDIIR